jgi:RNA polymerase sigma factor (TIGR02999 family)
MPASEEHDLTRLLREWADGDQEALEKLTPRVYRELHQLAELYMAQERPNHPLQTTSLINEAYIRLIQWKDVRWQGRTHFFAMAARLMRRVLVDIARRGLRAKRGGRLPETTFDENCVLPPDKPHHFVQLDEALTELAAMDSRKVDIVELRFFGGLSVQETAQVLHLSERTVLREWNLARAWLRLALKIGT